MGQPRTKERPSADYRLTLVRAKIERPKENFRDLERITYTLHGYIPGINMHVKSRKRPPGQIPTYDTSFATLTAAGDVVNNLRGALDHLMYYLAKARTPRLTAKQERIIYFPICENVAAYEKAMKGYKDLIHPDAVKLINALKPYKGGNEALFRLNYLNNASKHRLLLSMSGIVICRDAWVPRGVFMYKLGKPQFSGIYARPKVDDYILRAGKETLTKLGAGRREALLPTLRYLIDVVDGYVQQFLPFLN